MNADQAKELHLPSIIEAAGGQRDEHKGNDSEVWFRSPFREEKTPSLKATRGNNGRWIWTDYGTGKGGNVIAFANVILNREPDDRAISDALKWLRGLSAMQTMELPRTARATAPKIDQKPAVDRYRIVSRKQIFHRSNLRYLDSRGINKATAQLYLDEVTFADTQRERNLFGLGMDNEAGGVEISTATERAFKTCIGPKSFTHVDGDPSQSTHVFEGMFDFLTYLTMHDRSRPLGNAYVLHSVAMVERVVKAIKQAERNATVVLWLDNDAAGQEAAQKTMEALESYPRPVATMNHLYEGYKDLNEWYMATRPPIISADSIAPKMFHDTAWNQLSAKSKPTPN